ncbi:MAG TPA: holo-[acyl-carrier-protein] synthase [bacterium]|nr:holo-[acyl-carrier-protein] synthase [bacterium]
MIKGVGIDLVKIERIKKAINNNGKFLERVFTKKEIIRGEKKKNRYQFYGALFATKEAVMKALGTGWRKGVRWRDIQIIHNNDGKPEVRLVGKTKEIAKKLGINEVLVSMSHTKEYAVAQAIAIKHGLARINNG